jgi:hypothetical protein
MEWGTDWGPKDCDNGLLVEGEEGDEMIFSRIGSARQGMARPGAARQHVTQYGNWDNFLKAGQCAAGHGRAGRG